ncbi:MAG: DUF3567 family protein [Betaproteobacteria bacterium]|nr:DUF3567 family protein [Betaproteobacteria bacterium]
MKILYNSPHYQVVEYSAEAGFELLDKEAGFGAFIRGDVADRFRESLEIVIAKEPSPEEFEEFLGNFRPWMTQKVVLH